MGLALCTFKMHSAERSQVKLLETMDKRCGDLWNEGGIVRGVGGT